MTANSIERNAERFNTLPEDFQEAICTSDYDLGLQLTTKKHKLHIDQSAILEDLLARFIFGEIEPSNLISEMGSKLNITKEQATEIAKEIDELVITPIRQNLQKIQSQSTLPKVEDLK